MQKRLVCLLILVLFAGCAAKSRAASPEAVLAEIAAGRWELDVEASMRVDSAAREEIEKIGRDKFVADYGQLGFSIDTQKHVIAWYADRKTAANALSFAVAPESAEDATERKNGVRQVRLVMDDDKAAVVMLRYDGTGKLLFFMQDGRDELIGVFAPLEK